MNQEPRPGDTRNYRIRIGPQDCASFQGIPVHPVYATFALARDAEWCGRQFVLDMKSEDEEGIGTFISVRHLAPAPPGSLVEFTSTVESYHCGELRCSFEAWVGTHRIAEGTQVQKILKKERLESLFREYSEPS